jgi:1A family penicillin-binding protein
MKVAVSIPSLRSMVAPARRIFLLVGDRLGTIARRAPRLFAAGMGLVAIVFWIALGSAAWFTYDVTRTLPGLNELRAIGNMAQATVIYDRHDQPVFTIYKEQRIEVPLKQISPTLIKAVISIEDQRFFQHAGVDVWRILGAFVSNMRGGRVLQGASTITQQLARKSFPEKISQRQTYRRKLKEAILAALIERTYSKDQILEFYLNKVYFGDGFHGVEAAARGFFGKSAKDVTVDEAALLAGLIQSPSNYAPTINMEKAIARRTQVLQAMVDNQAIDMAAADRARAARVKLENGLQGDEGFGQYFKEQVRREIVARFGWTRVGEGGLRVYTTIDPDMQQMAEQAMASALEKIEARKNYKHPTRAQLAEQGDSHEYLQGAFVAMDPQSGEVRVMIGGRNFKESRFNRATQAKRQPGSAFKPFVFASAVESGMTAGTLITNLDEPVSTLQGDWMPEDEHSTAPAMTLRTALRTSSNRAAVRLLNTVGLRQTVDYVSKLHMGQMPQVPSLALGAAEVTLQSLTAAYGSFANGGQSVKPLMLRRIEDEEGRVLFEEKPELTPAFSKTTAFIVANMLTDVINAGTAYRARANGFALPAAGKTGTTNDYVDAWFVGFTPKLVAGVWIGFDQPRTIISNGYGGELAVPLWADFMKAATKKDKPTWLDRPEDVIGVEICRMSGKRPADGCSHVEVLSNSGELQVRSMLYTEYFVRGTEPQETCDLHDTGNVFQRLAGIFKPSEVAPVPAEAAGLPEREATAPATTATDANATATEGAAEADAKKEDEPNKKKRGFWSRIFGSKKKEGDPKPEEKP